MSDTNRPHPRNAPGDFYVVDGCCMFCGIPDATAPGLFEWDDMHCFVARQPTTPQEIESMVEAMSDAEVECIRYRGQDPEIVRSVVEYGERQLLDIAPPPHLRSVVRNHVTFDLTAEFSGQPTVKGVAESLETHLRGISVNPRSSYSFVGVRLAQGVASLSYGWLAEELHPIEVVKPQRSAASCLIRHSPVAKLGSRAISRILNTWLRAGPFQNVRWYSEEEWNQGSAGRPSPF